jgi:hypothetical protein
MALQQRDRRALKALALGLAVWAALRFAVFPVWDRWQQERSELEVRESALIKYRQALATVGSATASEQVLQKRLSEAEEGLLEGSTAALASAELQKWVRETTAKHGIDVRSSQFLPIRGQAEGYAQVPVGLRFECGLAELVDFLEELQRSEKTLAIPSLSVQAAGGKEKRVNVSMTVAGVMRAEPGGPSAARQGG